MRLYELATKLKVSNPEIVEAARALGFKVTSHMGRVEDPAVKKLRAFFALPAEKRAEKLKGTKKKAVKKKVAKKKVVKKKAVKKEAAPKAEKPEAKEPEAVEGEVAAPEVKAPAAKKKAVAKKKAAVGKPVAAKAEPEKPKAKKPKAKAAAEPKAVVDKAAKPKAAPPAAKPPRGPKRGPKKGPAKAAEAALPPPKARPKRRGATILGRIELPAAKPKAPAHQPGPPPTRLKRAPTARGTGFRRLGPHRGGPRTKTTSKRPAIIAPRKEKVELDPFVTVREFSQETGIRVHDIIRELMAKSVMLTINQTMPAELAVEIGQAHKIEVTFKAADDPEAILKDLDVPDDPEKQVARPPVVTLLGHVDHGKTSLLDAIRKTKVTETESGGITQHIGAYCVDVHGKTIAFLDTPGHEAFTAMRARGANVTDVVVLVVAADDGLMPQTEEAISHARAADVTIVVALNKIDKENANADRVRQQLSTVDLVPEDWGGKTVVVETSATTGQGVQELLELLSLEADLLELKADPTRPAVGTVIEAELTVDLGVVATVLVEKGTLHRGDYVLCGSVHGAARSLINDDGRSIPEAGPATPVQVTGLSAVPAAGDRFYVVADPADARRIAEQRAERDRQASLVQRQHVTLENLFSQLESGEQKEARFIVKADVQGTLEVILKTLSDLNTDEVATKVLHSGCGGINESDVLLADASDAILVGFRVMPESRALALAKGHAIEIALYQVIYELAGDMRKALEGMLEPERREVLRGHLDIKAVFSISRIGKIAGCQVTEGTITRNHRIRVVRNGVVIHDGRIASLRREKDDVREVQAGMECGVLLADFLNIEVGDTLVTYEIEEIARTLD